MKTFKNLLIELQACEDARYWAENKTIEEVVREIERGDWLLWLAKKIGIHLKPLTLAKARCAKTVTHLMKDQRSIDAVNIAEKFGMTDEVSEYDLRKSADAAYAAAYAGAYAADAAAAAYAAAYAADADADAADADVYAAAADVYAAKTKYQGQTADICREILGEMIIEKVNELLK